MEITQTAENPDPEKADKTKEVTKSLGPKALLPAKFSTTTTLKPFTKPFSGTNLTLKDTTGGQTQEFTPTIWWPLSPRLSLIPAKAGKATTTRPTVDINHLVRAEITQAAVIPDRATKDNGNINPPTALTNHPVRAEITQAEGNQVPGEGGQDQGDHEIPWPEGVAPREVLNHDNVKAIYEAILGHEPDPQGHEYWANSGIYTDDLGGRSLTGSTSSRRRRTMANYQSPDGAYQSPGEGGDYAGGGEPGPGEDGQDQGGHEIPWPEGVAPGEVLNHDNVKAIYEAILGHEPDPEGHDWWANSGIYTDDLVAALSPAQPHPGEGGQWEHQSPDGAYQSPGEGGDYADGGEAVPGEDGQWEHHSPDGSYQSPGEGGDYAGGGEPGPGDDGQWEHHSPDGAYQSPGESGDYAGNPVQAMTDNRNINPPTALTNHLVRAEITQAEGNQFPAKADKTKEVTKSLGPKALLRGKFSTTTTLRPFTKRSSGTNLTLKDTTGGQTQEFTPTIWWPRSLLLNLIPAKAEKATTTPRRRLSITR